MNNAGFIVKTEKGKTGRTYHSKGLINNKVPVYLEIEKFKYSDTSILCTQESLKVVGFVD